MPKTTVTETTTYEYANINTAFQRLVRKVKTTVTETDYATGGYVSPTLTKPYVGDPIPAPMIVTSQPGGYTINVDGKALAATVTRRIQEPEFVHTNGNDA